MRRPRFLPLPILFSFLVCRAFGADETQGDALYEGWLKMYDLRFEEAHQSISLWQKGHSADPLGPASHAAGYLFAELARLGVLESELFINDNRFKERRQLQADSESDHSFMGQIAASDRLADAALQNQPNNEHALFAKSLSLGLLADYSGLIEKHNLAALRYTKQSRTYSEKLLSVNPEAYDAYLGPGVENYLLSLKAAPARFVLRLTGSQINRQKGIEELRLTSAHGHYLEPFAKLLLAVAALRDGDKLQARTLLGELHDRFPQNPLYARELVRVTAPTE